MDEYYNYSYKKENLDMLKKNIQFSYQSYAPASCSYLLPNVLLYRMTQNESYLSSLETIVSNSSFTEYIYGSISDVDWRCGDVLYEIGKKEQLQQLLLNEKDKVLACSYPSAMSAEKASIHVPSSTISLRQISDFLYLYSKLEVDLA